MEIISTKKNQVTNAWTLTTRIWQLTTGKSQNRAINTWQVMLKGKTKGKCHHPSNTSLKHLWKKKHWSFSWALLGPKNTCEVVEFFLWPNAGKPWISIGNLQWHLWVGLASDLPNSPNNMFHPSSWVVIWKSGMGGGSIPSSSLCIHVWPRYIFNSKIAFCENPFRICLDFD